MPRLPDGQFRLAAACFPDALNIVSDLVTVTYMAAGGIEDIFFFFQSQKEEDKSVAKFNG